MKVILVMFEGDMDLANPEKQSFRTSRVCVRYSGVLLDL